MASVDALSPPSGHEHGDGSDPQSPAYGSSFFLAGSAEEAAHFAALRERFGDEVVEGILRDRALHEHPRPLTENEREVLRQAAGPVLRDMAATGAVMPDIREEAHEDRGDEVVSAWVGGRTASLVWVSGSRCPVRPQSA